MAHNSKKKNSEKELTTKQKIIKWVPITLHIINGALFIGFLVYLYFVLYKR